GSDAAGEGGPGPSCLLSPAPCTALTPPDRGPLQPPQPGERGRCLHPPPR
ncbi:hypothetical protein NDU88_009514, partial [Pleurodeles waltl]